jgi:large subunit ribosomal protein L21
MFAVIKAGGRQIRVAADDVVEVDRLAGEAGEKVTFGEVLMVGGDDGITIGAPLVAGASVSGEVVAQERTRKVLVFKKRRRKNSRRLRGHRQHLTKVRITAIDLGGSGSRPARSSRSKAAAPEADEASAGA